MIVALIIALLLCAGIGTFFNYLGVETMRCAFELAGGSAIGMFSAGFAFGLICSLFFMI